MIYVAQISLKLWKDLPQYHEYWNHSYEPLMTYTKHKSSWLGYASLERIILFCQLYACIYVSMFIILGAYRGQRIQLPWTWSYR